jgi:hypothetical protein
MSQYVGMYRHRRPERGGWRTFGRAVADARPERAHRRAFETP